MNEVTYLEVRGLFGRFNLQQRFYRGVNVLYGKNGAGKTTLLHILANLLNGDFERFTHLAFESITLEMADGTVIELQKQSNYENQPPLLNVAYFPAFRLMIEAWRYTRASLSNDQLAIMRHYFGQFIPKQNYFSSVDIQKQLLHQEKELVKQTLNWDDHSFKKHMVNNGKDIVLPDTLQTILQSFLVTLNKFYKDKEIVLNPVLSSSPLVVNLANNKTMQPLNSLSLGEQQLITLLYAASHLSEHDILLIDEPEISLHVDWQRELLNEMENLVEGKQIIVCTHSPVILANHRGHTQRVELTPTQSTVKGNYPHVSSERIAA